jgi:hypothetical protein
MRKLAGWSAPFIFEFAFSITFLSVISMLEFSYILNHFFENLGGNV